MVKHVFIMDNYCLPMAILKFADHIVIMQIVENMVLMNTWTSCILAKSIVATMDKGILKDNLYDGEGALLYLGIL
jgi:hypothetical protein